MIYFSDLWLFGALEVILCLPFCYGQPLGVLIEPVLNYFYKRLGFNITQPASICLS